MRNPREAVIIPDHPLICPRKMDMSPKKKETDMKNLKKILLVEDDGVIREALSEELVRTGEFDVIEAVDADAALKNIAVASFDLGILDIELPDMDGRELCKRLRKQGVSFPIIMLTGKDGDSDIVLGLDSGANDYVTKPFKFLVLLARIRAQLRQHEQSEDAVLSIGPFSFRPGQKLLVNDKDEKIRLTEKEASILKFLYKAPDGHVARDVLLQEVWGYSKGVDTHTLETHIYRLRQKMEPDPANAVYLVTEGRGYRLVAQ